MSVLFCRHGETVFNLEDKFQGVSDSPLTEKGQRQAELLGKYLASHFLPKLIYISPLPRVRKTVEIVLQQLGAEVPIHVRSDLKEVCYGEWETKSKEELRKLPEWSVRQSDRFHFVHPGSFEGQKGESYADLYQRLKPLFTEVQSVKENIVICSHIGVMRSVMKYYNHLSDEETGKLEVPQSTVCIVKDEQMETLNLENFSQGVI